MSNCVTYVKYLPWPGREQLFRVRHTGAGLFVDRLIGKTEDLEKIVDTEDHAAYWKFWRPVSYEETQKILNFVTLQALGFVTSTVKVIPEDQFIPLKSEE